MSPALRLRRPRTPRPALALLLAAACAASVSESVVESELGCSYGGRWYVSGSVTSLAGCVRCACARGVLSCARRVCAEPPQLPPACRLVQRRAACCPEVHCPDGVTSLEDDSTVDDEELLKMAKSAALEHSCSWEGGVFSLGSALGAQCSACYCARGGPACARAACLPPPPHCTPHPAPDGCCPTSYHCQHNQTTPSHQQYDCEVNGEWISEGSAVPQRVCSQCYCLRGEVRCQPQRCAPPLRGCTPHSRPGDCCPHRYTCTHRDPSAHHDAVTSDNALISTRHIDRSIHSNITNGTKTSPSSYSASTTLSTTVVPSKPTTTVKFKRKTSVTLSTKHQKLDESSFLKQNTHKSTTAVQPDVTTVKTETTQVSLQSTTTDQPDETVKVVVNGTINCQAEISSLNITSDDSKKISLQAMPRVPLRATVVEAQPGDIITERTGGSFDEDSFTINVTSSLRTNTSGPAPPAPAAPPISPSNAPALNASRKTTDDYDYDYVEPTLPPSLPNLKIIPFVAADAVVEDAPAKDTALYPMDKEDKFPVYYPTVESKGVPYAERREDVYSTQYPVFVSKIESPYKYLGTDLKEDRNDEETLLDSDEEHSEISEYSHPHTLLATSPRPATSLEVKPPAVNLFSPPSETEGGFIPKGPGIIDEYYAVYPSTHVPPSLPHLTTSMQLNTVKEGSSDCLTSEGRRVSAGESVDVSCSVCMCFEGRMSCSPRSCPRPPPSCVRRPSSSARHDPCCGEIVCHHENKTTPAPLLPARRTEITLNETKVPLELLSEIIPFDPPADRREPPTTPRSTTSSSPVDEQKNNDLENKTTTTDITVNTSTSTEPPLNIVEKNNSTSQNKNSISTPRPEPTTMTPTSETHDVDNTTSSLEYEDEDEDEGFSFGSVLKLLLSDSYDSTTISPLKKKLATFIPPTTRATSTTTVRPLMTTRRFATRPSVAPFIPLPHHSYTPPKKVLPPLTANRIDHLVLGEATAIRKTTARPNTTRMVTRPSFPYKGNMPIMGSLPKPSFGSVPNKISAPSVVSVTTVRNIPSETGAPSGGIVSSVPSVGSTPIMGSVPTVGSVSSVPHPGHVPSVGGAPSVSSVGNSPSRGGVSMGGSLGGGLLKLAGCNIYGRMYSVGAEIGELAARCQRCRCEDLGVHCTTTC